MLVLKGHMNGFKSIQMNSFTELITLYIFYTNIVNKYHLLLTFTASLGDLVTLALLSAIASVLYADRLQDRYCFP